MVLHLERRHNITHAGAHWVTAFVAVVSPKATDPPCGTMAKSDEFLLGLSGDNWAESDFDSDE